MAEILIGLVADTFRWLRLSVRSSRSIKAENLFLRCQLALYIERGVKPRRIDFMPRTGLECCHNGSTGEMLWWWFGRRH